MIKNGKKRLTLSLKQLQYDFLDFCSKDNNMTKSELMEKLLFKITLDYWSDPESWKGIFKNDQSKK